MGFGERDFTGPTVAIVNSWSETTPGHYHLRDLATAVKEGVRQAGGMPVEFNTAAPCDGIAQGPGMRYVLPLRDVIAASIELMIEAHLFDAAVMLGTCDKIVPAMLMAAARVDLPTIFLPGGPARPGSFRGQPTTFPTDVALTLVNEYLSEKIDAEQMREQMHQMEGRWVTGCGACPELTTANTVQMATDWVNSFSLP